VFLSSLIDDLGLCGIQTGNVMGFAAELYQRGILSKEDLDGLDLKWGNADAFAALAKNIAFRKGIGDVLAEGTYRAALKLGKMKKKDLLPYAVQSKGVSIGAHGIRSGKDFPEIISYACGVQCGDHTSLTGLPLENSELMETFNDSAVFCSFNSFAGPPRVRFDFYSAITGVRQTKKEWCTRRALKTLQLQRALLLLGGPDATWNPRVDDDNPQRFYEPLPSGPKRGKTADRDAVEEYKQRYYKEVGWDKNGIPTSETLAKLGLKDVNKALKNRLREEKTGAFDG
jgi:aldehyde:ferredoxin oxidoreductase